MTGDLIIRSLMGPPGQEKIFGSSLYIFHLFFDLRKKLVKKLIFQFFSIQDLENTLEIRLGV